MLWAAAVSPNHHDHTSDNHRDRENLPHADVLYPCAGKLRIRLAEEFNNDTKRAIANQEQARDSPHRARLADKQVKNNEQHDTFQHQLIQLGRMARQNAIGIKDRLPLRV